MLQRTQREHPPFSSDTREHKTYGSGDHRRGSGGLPRRLDLCDGANSGVVATGAGSAHGTGWALRTFGLDLLSCVGVADTRAIFPFST